MKDRYLYLESEHNLTSLAEAAFRFSPKVYLCRERKLYLEISGTAKLFGGEAALLAQWQRLLVQFGLSEPWVCCDRIEWARALLSGGKGCLSVGSSRVELLRLPIESLQYVGSPLEDEETERSRERLSSFLRRVGITTIGSFAQLPHSAVLRRFGKTGADFLGWVSGERACPLPIFCPQEKISEAIDTEEVSNLEGLLFYVRQQLVKIQARLQGRMLAAKALALRFVLESHPAIERSLSLAAPTQESTVLLRLLQEYLGQMQWESPLQRLEIEVAEGVPFLPGQMRLFDEGESRFEELAQYITRLKVRLGEQAVGYAVPAQSHLPERSWLVQWPPPQSVEPLKDQSHRPLFLFDPPKPCPPPQGATLVPSENIQSEWWEGVGPRQYFILQRSGNEKQWVYFDAVKTQWFVHGIFE